MDPSAGPSGLGGAPPEETEPAELTDQQRQEYDALLRLLGEPVIRLLVSKTWAHREKAVKQVQEYIQDCTDLPHGFVLLPTVALPMEKVHAFKGIMLFLQKAMADKIVQVFHRSTVCFKTLLSSCVLKRVKKDEVYSEFKALLPLACSKLGETNSRIKNSAVDCVIQVAKASASAPLVAADAVVEPVKPATNLKLLAGKLECLLKLIKESKLAVVCPPGLEKIMPFIVTGLASANAQVRNTAQQCAFEVFRLVNNEIEPHLKGVKPAVMSTLRGGFTKIEQNPEADVGAVGDSGAASSSVDEPSALDSSMHSEEVVFAASKITKEIIVSRSQQTVLKNESFAKFLARLTHLKLNNLQLDKIDNLKYCENLRVLYLYDNRIPRLENLEFATNLTHLYLQNNNLAVMEGFSRMTNLRKLYLDNNAIIRVQGLEACTHLEELHISNQRLPSEECSMTFAPETLQALSHSLVLLNVSGDKIRTIAPLSVLQRMSKLNLSRNFLVDFEEIGRVMDSCRSVVDVDLSGNPITRLPKYRERVILLSSRLELLDGMAIKPRERTFLRSLEEQKRKRSQYPSSRSDEGSESSSDSFDRIPPRVPVLGEKVIVRGRLVSSALSKLPADSRDGASSKMSTRSEPSYHHRSGSASRLSGIESRSESRAE